MKKGGSIRVTSDYEGLGGASIAGEIPIPRIDEIPDTLRQSESFTALDFPSCTGSFRLLLLSCLRRSIVPRLVHPRVPLKDSGCLRERPGSPQSFERPMSCVTKGVPSVGMCGCGAIVPDTDPPLRSSSLGNSWALLGYTSSSWLLPKRA